jgi:hypothetical protein
MRVQGSVSCLLPIKNGLNGNGTVSSHKLITCDGQFLQITIETKSRFSYVTLYNSAEQSDSAT